MSRIAAIDSSSAVAPLTSLHGQKVFRLRAGTHAGRVVVLYRPSASDISLRWSDPPYRIWSQATPVATDSHDSGFGACMQPDGSIHVAYTQATSLALVTYKLIFDGENWTTLTQQTIYNADANYDPSLEYEEGQNRIWVVWTRYVAGSAQYLVGNKRSLDDGVTWGLGSSDPGTDLSSGSSGCVAQVFRSRDFMHCIYQDGGTAYRHTRYYVNSAIWSTPADILTGSGFDRGFHAAVSADGRVGVVMADGASLKYREYDGENWGTVQTVTATTPLDPSLAFAGASPVGMWGEDRGSGYTEWLHAVKQASGFGTPAPLNPVRGKLDHLLLYSATAATPYADLTIAAGDSVAGDVVHPASGGLVLQQDDAIYCGLSEPFDLVIIVLATPGSGGTVQWEYWNGSIWQPIIPASGHYDLDTSPHRLRLFADTWAVPADWRVATVNGATAYWVRARVTTPFSTAPVGSQWITTDTMAELQPLADLT